MGPELALRRAGRALERIRRLAEVLAVTDELEASQRRGPRGGDALLHDVRTAIVKVEGGDRRDFRLALAELHEQVRELSERRPLGIGLALLRHLPRPLRDRPRGRLK